MLFLNRLWLCSIIVGISATSILALPFKTASLEAAHINENLIINLIDPPLDSLNLKILKGLVQPIHLNPRNEVVNEFIFLNERLTNKEVFGLGEATHGTKEFFELKADFFKYLVKHHNVRLFGIEANFAACYDINRYILTGQGNAKDALFKNGYWVWKTQEVLDLIEWMRLYNSSLPDERKVQFYGYDMQSASASVEWLEDYLTKAFPDFDTKMLITKFDRDRESMLALRNLNNSQLDSVKSDGLQKMNVLDAYLDEHKTKFIQSGLADFQFAKQCIEVLRQKLTFFRISNFNDAYSFRDSSMTANINWIREKNGNGKIMLWAHNGHVGKGSFSDDFKSGNWMGTHLQKMYGTKYFNIGFCFNEGGFVAHAPKSTNFFYIAYSFTKSIFKDEPWRIKKNYVKPYKKGYLTKEFSKLQTHCFFLDFNKLNSHKELKDFVNKEHAHYEAGAAFIRQKSAIWSLNLYPLFDAIIYVDKVTAAENFRIGEYE